MRQVASSLGAAHAQQIVHRDLKPENIFIVRDPEVVGGERAKIVDFGIAKIIDDPKVKTNTSAVLGTPLYMSPEQCRGAGLVDQRSDIYALGCVLFKLITGEVPFDADGAGDIIAMHLREPPRAPSQVAPGIPYEVDALVLACLAKDPARRFSSGTDLAQALGALAAMPLSSPNIATYAPPPRVPTAPTSATTLSAATGATSRPPAATHTRTLVVVGALAAGAGVIGAIAARFSDDKPKAADPRMTVVPAPTPVESPKPAPVAAPEPQPAAAKPTPEVEATPAIKDELARFVAWSKTHAGAPCPDAAALGGAVNDPWGEPIVLTCSDQPSDQIVGARSAGPDRKPGTEDDIASWQLGRDVTDVVRGVRWTVAGKRTAPAKHAHSATPASSDDIPDER